MPRWIWFIIALIFGLAGGLYFGWVLNPVSYVDTTPDSLRADYRADYVLMVAEAFSASQDPSTAARQLAILGSQPPAATVGQALAYAHSVNFSVQDIELIQKLAFAMQTWGQPTPGSGLP